MERTAKFLLLMIVLPFIGCSGGGDSNHMPRPTDTLYTKQAAMNIFAYQPERALQILDSAVIVGNLSKENADMYKARIYSFSLMKDQLDSLLGGPKDIRLDSARIIGEHLLKHDSIKADLKKQLDVLEILINTARLQNDTMRWMQRSSEFVDICHQMGPEEETNALRTEAEIGASLCAMGQEQGMAKMDSVINILSDKKSFNELDALIIALKRKIVILGSNNHYAETLPLARQIIERLDDYEQHPDDYHDGSYREPQDETERADYIRFYRSQAQNFITAAYTSLVEHGDMLDVFEKIELGVRETTGREHLARYNSLQHQMEAERQEAKTNRASLIAFSIGCLALLFLAFSVIVFYKNRTIKRKNRILAQQIAEAVSFKAQYWKEKRAQLPTADPDFDTLTNEQLFQYIHEIIVRERLFLSPTFGRQTIMDRFQLSKERVGAVFSKGSKHAKLTSYIQLLRLEYSAKLLVEQPDTSIVQIAADSGFSSSSYFSDRFHQHFGMSPTDYRRAVPEERGTHSIMSENF